MQQKYIIVSKKKYESQILIPVNPILLENSVAISPSLW